MFLCLIKIDFENIVFKINSCLNIIKYSPSESSMCRWDWAVGLSEGHFKDVRILTVLISVKSSPNPAAWFLYFLLTYSTCDLQHWVLQATQLPESLGM